MQSDYCYKAAIAASKASTSHTFKKVGQSPVKAGFGGFVGGVCGVFAGSAVVAGGGIVATAFPPLAPLVAIHIPHIAGAMFFGGMAWGAEVGSKIK
jgi:hypothetical protein